jgi:hypothetical protein
MIAALATLDGWRVWGVRPPRRARRELKEGLGAGAGCCFGGRVSGPRVLPTSPSMRFMTCIEQKFCAAMADRGFFASPTTNGSCRSPHEADIARTWMRRAKHSGSCARWVAAGFVGRMSRGEQRGKRGAPKAGEAHRPGILPDASSADALRAPQAMP